VRRHHLHRPTFRRRGCSPAAGLLGFALLGFAPPAAHAQRVELRLDVDKHIATVGEAVGVSVHLTIDGRGSYSEFLPPRMEGFERRGGGMTSQQTEIVNWQVRQREVRSYIAIPLKQGTLTIGPAAVRISGKLIQSNTVKVHVKEGSSSAATPDQDAQDDTLDEPQAAGPSPGVPRGGVLPSVFIGAAASPTKVYVGQQLVAQWRLYTQSDVLGFQMLKQPTADGFWMEELESPRRLRFERHMIQGRLFYSALITRKAFFPQRAGTLVLGPMEAQIRTMDLFAGPVTRRSEQLSVEVLPLPQAGQPKDFAEPNVGRYDIAAALDRHEVAAGDAVTLKIVIRGSGNLQQLVAPKLGKLDGLKVYEPKVSVDLDKTNELQGEKVVEYLLLPTRSGKLTIPSLTLQYFDPGKQRYRSASTLALELNVTGKMVATGTTRGDGTQNVLGQDIRPPLPARTLMHRRQPTAIGPIRVALVIFPLAVLLLLAAYDAMRQRLARPTERALDRATAKKVRESLRQAAEHERAGDSAGLFAALANALREQLRHQLGRPVEGLTRDELRQQMQQAGMTDDLVRDVINELDNCDFARFAPSASDPQQLQDATQRTRQLVRRLASAGKPFKGRDRSQQVNLEPGIKQVR